MENVRRTATLLIGLTIVTSIGAILYWIPTPKNQQFDSEVSGTLNRSEVYTVTLYNDTSNGADFEAFVFGDYTNTVTTIGEIQSGHAATVTLPVGGGRYGFYLEADISEETAYLDASVTEERLDHLDYVFRFLEDDMGLMVLSPTEWPTSPSTPEEITGPTSTYGPEDTPSSP